MPIYAYSCAACGHRFEELVAMDAAAPSCPACGSDGTVERRLSSFTAGPAFRGENTFTPAMTRTDAVHGHHHHHH
jgi:putative FmdB family regulatory protein